MIEKKIYIYIYILYYILTESSLFDPKRQTFGGANTRESCDCDFNRFPASSREIEREKSRFFP